MVFSSVAYALGKLYKNPLPDLEAMKIYPLISSQSFTVFSSYISFLTHFQLIFIYDLKYGSNIICLHVDVQLSQNHLLKRLFFSLQKVLVALLKLV